MSFTAISNHPGCSYFNIPKQKPLPHPGMKQRFSLTEKLLKTKSPPLLKLGWALQSVGESNSCYQDENLAS